MVGVEDQAVVDVRRRRGDLADEAENGVDVVGDGRRLQVDVRGRPTGVERRQQHTALQHEPVAVRRFGHAAEEPLQGVERKQLVGGSLLLSCLVSQVEVGPAVDGCSGGPHRTHGPAGRLKR